MQMLQFRQSNMQSVSFICGAPTSELIFADRLFTALGLRVNGKEWKDYNHTRHRQSGILE